MNYSQRISKAQKGLQVVSCNALLIEETVNLYYLTGQSLSSGNLLVHEQGAHLIVDNRYFESCQKNAPCPVIQSEKTSLWDLLKSKELEFICSLGFDAENTSFKRYEEMQKKLDNSIKLTPLDNPIKFQRRIKDQEEIDILREAAALGSQGFDFICSLLHEGIRENEIALELEIFWKRRGSKSLAFDPIIAFGPNSSMPHYRAGQTILKKGMPVLIDIGVNYQHYHSDMTRVVYFGEPDPQIRTIYGVVEKAQKAALSLCVPGTSIGKLDEMARNTIQSEGFGDFFNHSLGHGVGLEIHESPTVRNKSPCKDRLLEPGMVITIEPGIYLPGVGGVRIEDTILITENGHENLTKRPTSPLLYQ
jgi:Xaa-Pro aminopeptidase